MLILRPTQSLARRLRVTPEAGTESPSSAPMAEWYARDFRLGRVQLVLFTNPLTALSVVMKAAPYGDLAERFRDYFPDYLKKLGWTDAKERLAPALENGTHFLKPQDRSTIGIMTQLVKEIEVEFELGRIHPEDVSSMSRRLAETLIGGARPGGYQHPIENFQRAVGIPLTPPDYARPFLQLVGGTTFKPTKD